MAEIKDGGPEIPSFMVKHGKSPVESVVQDVSKNKNGDGFINVPVIEGEDGRVKMNLEDVEKQLEKGIIKDIPGEGRVIEGNFSETTDVVKKESWINNLLDKATNKFLDLNEKADRLLNGNEEKTIGSDDVKPIEKIIEKKGNLIKVDFGNKK